MSTLKINHAPQKMLLVFDGDCHFCRYWIARYHSITGDRVEYAPYQEVAINYLSVPLESFKSAVKLITPDGEVYSGAEAIFRVLATVPYRKWPLWLYEHFPGFKFVAEFFYEAVARNRPFFSFLTRICWGSVIQPPSYFIVRWIFLRAMGLIYLLAFISLGIQILGLVGSKGILPAQYFLDAVASQFGPVRFWVLPSVFWLGAHDLTLRIVCGVGVGLSLSVMLGFAQAPVLFFLWGIYLSFLSICRDFLGFQWDILLLEMGFLAIFLAPLQIKPNLGREAPASKLILFLFSWLLFRLMLMSGLVKILSGDPTWRNLTALTFHYETQPLPTWIGWGFHQAPEWFQKFSAFLMFIVEISVPFFIFSPRRIRAWAGATIGTLQVLIFATGNYCFFNLLTLLLCLLLFDDAMFPIYIRRKVESARNWSHEFPSRSWPKIFLIPFLGVVLSLTGVQMTTRLGFRVPWPTPVIQLAKWAYPFHSFNSYGLFAVMTHPRNEIVVEGSNDGKNWLAYEFKYKPGDLSKKPAFVEPHQPRLDWQMWFAALGSYKDNPWFINFLQRLLDGAPSVLALLKENPFPLRPPKYIRAVMYEYHFTNFKTLQETGRWWSREDKGLYCPVLQS